MRRDPGAAVPAPIIARSLDVAGLLQVLVEKIGLPDTAKPSRSQPDLACTQANDHWAQANPRNAILEFSRDRKSMSTLCGFVATKGSGRSTRAKSGTGENMLYVKGAPESVLERCNRVRLASGDVHIPIHIHIPIPPHTPLPQQPASLHHPFLSFLPHRFSLFPIHSFPIRLRRDGQDDPRPAQEDS